MHRRILEADNKAFSIYTNDDIYYRFSRVRKYAAHICLSDHFDEENYFIWLTKEELLCALHKLQEFDIKLSLEIEMWMAAKERNE